MCPGSGESFFSDPPPGLIAGLLAVRVCLRPVQADRDCELLKVGCGVVALYRRASAGASVAGLHGPLRVARYRAATVTGSPVLT